MDYLYPTTFFESDDRDTDGLYSIASGNVHIFPFQVPFMGQQIITLQHLMPGSQDWSINVWLTSEPYDEILFPNQDDWDDFRIGRDIRELSIWATGYGEDTDKHLEPGTTYYLNVRNLQNQTNGYKLTFLF